MEASMVPLLQRCARALAVLSLLLVFRPSEGASLEDTGAPRQAASKPAWSWPTAERLSQRFNPQSIQARADKLLVKERAFKKSFPAPVGKVWEVAVEGSAPGRPIVDRIDGNETPELFLPSELFDALLNMGFPPDGAFQNKTQEIIEKRAVALGFGRDIWRRLNAASAPYLKLRSDYERTAGARQPATVETLAMGADELRWCRARSTAMAAAKADFGEESFLRLLYQAVAPNISKTYLVKNGYAAHARFLLFVEEGCRCPPAA
jgi:hypothetical protein